MNNDLTNISTFDKDCSISDEAINGESDMANGRLTQTEIRKMTLREINSLEAKLAEAKVNAEQQAKEEIKEKIDSLLEETGFSIYDLYPQKRSYKKVPMIRYVNPNNRSQTWSGFGRKPYWLVELLESGIELSDLEV